MGRFYLSAAIIGLSSIASLPAWAQISGDAAPVPETTGDQNEEGVIVVTAQRREERLQDVPLTVTALSGDLLSSGGVGQSSDLDKLTPGLNLPRSGYALQPTIRGIGTTSGAPGNDPNVAIYVDNVYMPNQVGNIFDFNNLQSVEVLKGPQGTLFGRNATGGAILVRTLDPSFDAPHVRLGASYGNLNDVQLNGYVNLPLGSNAAMNVAVLYHDDDGYASDIVTGARLATTHEMSVRAKFRFEPSSNINIVLAGDYTDRSDNVSYTLKPRTSSTSQAGAIVPADPRLFALSFVPDISGKQGGLSLHATFDLGPAELASTSSYRTSRSHVLADSDRSQVNASYTDFHIHDDTYTQELILTSTGKGAFSWILGGFGYWDHAGIPDFKSSSVNPNLDSDLITRAYSAFGEAKYELSEAFSVTAGLRYSYEYKHYHARNPTTGAVNDASDSWKNLSPRLSLIYALSAKSNIYATYSKGFKSGAYNSQVFALQKVTPETLDSIEAGFKTSSHGLTFNASGFYYWYNNIQVTATILGSAASSQLLNAAAGKVYGVDAELIVSLTDEFKLRSALNYTHARFSSFPGAVLFTPRPSGGNIQSTGDASGNPFSRSPDFTASTTLTYDKHFDAGRIVATATGSYNGGFYWDFGKMVREDPYFVLNAGISFSPPSDKWTVSLWGRNLTDELYSVYVVPTTITTAAAYAKPRTYGASFELRF